MKRLMLYYGIIHIILIFIILSPIKLLSQPGYSKWLKESKAEKDQRMQWWKEARFGMFIHWGAYAVLAGEYQGKTVPGAAEWIMETAKIPVEVYEQEAKKFNPEHFNAEEWVMLAHNAGMKYIVITSKHHDGFCMWDTRTTSYSITSFTPFKRDPLKELSDACKKYRIHFGVYYSIMDWHHPDAKGKNFTAYRDQNMKPQISEIITRYDPDIMWFDGEWIDEWTEEQGKDLYAFVRDLKPSMIINNRVGKGRDGMKGTNKDPGAAGDFCTPEQEIVDKSPEMAWETCMTMNDSWGFKINDLAWKSSNALITNLIDVTAKGGNFLLNVGPDAQGLIPEISQQRLRKMGAWIKTNQQALYKVIPLERFRDSKDVYLIQHKSGDTIFAVVLNPKPGNIVVRGVKPVEGSKVYMAGNPNSLEWKFNPTTGLTVDIPSTFKIPSDVAITLAIYGAPCPVSDDPVFLSENKEVSNPFLFTRSTSVSVRKPLGNSRILWKTVNDDQPASSVSWQDYKRPAMLSQSSVISAYILEEDKVQSNIATLNCIKIIGISEIKLSHESDVKYSGAGTLTLFDKKKGSGNFNDGQWLGFHGVPFEALVDLGIQREISSISIGFLLDQASWIFLPETIIIEAGDTRDELVPVRSFENSHQQNEIPAGRNEFKVELPLYKARFIKITGTTSGTCPDNHPGAGQPSWIFADEIMIE